MTSNRVVLSSSFFCFRTVRSFLLIAVLFVTFASFIVFPHTFLKSASTSSAVKATDSDEIYDSTTVQPLIDSICGDSPIAEDVFVAIKTGATEAHSKLPAHFDTTLKCLKHVGIFSDLEESIQGHHVQDVLEHVHTDTKEVEPEFGLYRQLRQYKSEQRTRSDYQKLFDFQGMKEDNPAWLLDKWKFIPILERALELAPAHTRWFVFMEADTNIFWPSLYSWLERLDPAAPWYLGSQWHWADRDFAHGGPGFVLSAPAINAAVSSIRLDRPGVEAYMADEQAGDYALAQILRRAGVTLTPAWPLLQGDLPATFGYHPQHWCSPVISQHHMEPEDIQTMWRFQQSLSSTNSNRPILHQDLFNHFVEPHLTKSLVGWDNMASTERRLTSGFVVMDEERSITPVEAVAWQSIDDCVAACEELAGCVQWSYEPGICGLSMAIRLGKKVEDAKEAEDWASGWMLDRIQKLKEYAGDCTDAKWLETNSPSLK